MFSTAVRRPLRVLHPNPYSFILSVHFFIASRAMNTIFYNLCVFAFGFLNCTPSHTRTAMERPYTVATRVLSYRVSRIKHPPHIRAPTPLHLPTLSTLTGCSRNNVHTYIHRGTIPTYVCTCTYTVMHRPTTYLHIREIFFRLTYRIYLWSECKRYWWVMAYERTMWIAHTCLNKGTVLYVVQCIQYIPTYLQRQVFK